jgi:hypothetical protein
VVRRWTSDSWEERFPEEELLEPPPEDFELEDFELEAIGFLLDALTAIWRRRSLSFAREAALLALYFNAVAEGILFNQKIQFPMLF